MKQDSKNDLKNYRTLGMPLLQLMLLLAVLGIVAAVLVNIFF